MFNMKSITSKIKKPAFYDQISPTQRKAVLIVIAAFILIVIYKLIDATSGGEKKQVRKNARKEQTTVFTDKNTRQLGIEGLSSVVTALEKNQDKQQALINKLQEENEDLKTRRGQGENVPQQIQQLNQTITSLKGALKRQGWDIEDIKEDLGGPDQKKVPPSLSPSATPAPINQSAPKVNQSEYYQPPGDVSQFQSADIATPTPIKNIDGEQARGRDSAPPKIQTIEAKADEVESTAVILNAGSIITGVAINGVDVPSGEGSKKDPYPMLIRVQEDTILPNEYRADIKECFVSVSGYGELSSERYVARGEIISCRTKDDKVIEEEFPAYLVGEDGKPGMRGVLVNRTGQLIANAAMANTSKAIATAFSTSPVPIIDTGVSNSKGYRSNFSSDAGKYAGSQGLSGAADVLAEYWLKRADQILPVIEIEPGRRVTMHVEHKIVLSPKSLSVLNHKK